eukprot:gene8846-biopygen18164
MAWAWRGHGVGVARTWRGHGVGVARAWRGRCAGMACGPSVQASPARVAATAALTSQRTCGRWMCGASRRAACAHWGNRTFPRHAKPFWLTARATPAPCPRQCPVPPGGAVKV